MNGPPAPRMDLQRITEAGDRFRDAEQRRERALEDIVADIIAAGPNRNVQLAAKLSGVSRPTLYARLRAHQEKTPNV